MPTNRTPLCRHPRHRLSFLQEQSLGYGEFHGPPAFPSDAARRESWMRHRDYFLRRCRHGWRPAAWWDYEALIKRPLDSDYEKAALWEANLLSVDERAELESDWRERFERAQDPGFEFCIGHAKPGDTFATWVKGTPAKRAQYKWAGIPHELIRRWTEERKRRSKATRKLQEEHRRTETKKARNRAGYGSSFSD
jgi:hypothetical protein